MKTRENITKEEYDAFVENSSKSHFLQSYDWGTFAQKEKHLTPHYLALEEEGKIIAATLLLEKKLPLGYTYLYAPRGFVLDYQNTTLLKTFTDEVNKFAKKRKAIFIKIDPDIIVKRIDWKGEEKEVAYDRNHFVKQMKSIGFRHLGWTQAFETMQPRFSFRIDNHQTKEEIYDHFSKTTKQRIKKAEEYEVEVTIGEEKDIADFYHLMRLTEDRKDFVTHNEQYYKTLYHIFHSQDKCNLFLGKVHLDKLLEKKEFQKKELEEKLEELQKIENRSKSQNTKKKEMERELEHILQEEEKWKKYKQEYGSTILLNAHFIIEYGNKAWVLYAGNHNILTETYANYKTYYEHIQYYKDRVDIYDQFGTIGSLPKEDPLYGLHEFKKKFGGDYVEFIGEFDYVRKPLLYFAFTKLVPFYRNRIKQLAKKKNRRNVL